MFILKEFVEPGLWESGLGVLVVAFMLIWYQILALLC